MVNTKAQQNTNMSPKLSVNVSLMHSKYSPTTASTALVPEYSRSYRLEQEEKQKLLTLGRVKEDMQELSLPSLFEKQAMLHPENIAGRCRCRRIS